MAYRLARGNFRGRWAVELLLQLAVVMPPAVVGVALLVAFGRFGVFGEVLARAGVEIAFTPLAVIMAQCFVACPHFIKTAAVGLSAVDDELVSVAHLEGASGWQLFWRILLPLGWRGCAVGAVMAWARALGEFGATILFAGNYPGRTQTLPLAVYVGFEAGLDKAVVLSVVLLFFAGLVLLVTHWLTQRQ